MASYSSFKKISSTAIIDGEVKDADVAVGTLSSSDIASISSGKIANNAISAADKLASTVDLSTKTVTYRPITNNDISNSANIAANKIGTGQRYSRRGPR